MSDLWYANPFTGLFRRFGPIAPRPHDPDLPLCSGNPAPWSTAQSRNRQGADIPELLVPTRGSDVPDVEASGIGWNEAHAEGACVGEAIERLQAYPLPDDELIEASYDSWALDDPAIAPSSWVLFHPDQYNQPGFPFAPFTESSVCRWVRCRRADDGTSCWAPEEMVYLNLRPGVAHRHCPGYSTGLAGGRTGDPLLLRGLQEVLERDATMGAWWGRYPLHEDPASAVFAWLLPKERARFERPNLRYRFFRIDSPFTRNTTWVTLEGEDREGWCFSIGSACRETLGESWKKAILEAVHGRHYVRFLRAQVAEGKRAHTHCPATFADHAVFYSLHPQALSRTVLESRVLSAGRGGESCAALDQQSREDLSLLLQRLGPQRPVLFRDMTPPAFASEGLGWHVLRVLVPGLQPLHGNHAWAHLGGSLWAPRSGADWLRQPPHPFP